MVSITKKIQQKGVYILLLLCIIVVLLFFWNDLAFLFVTDPPIEKIYQRTFGGIPLGHADETITHKGFIVTQQGLNLMPGTSGSITFSFNKEQAQGSLLRVWFYGDRGTERPNAIKVSVDDGRTFRQVAGSGNYSGSVFDLSPYVMGSRNFKLLFEAKNFAPFPSVVLDSMAVVIAREHYVQPPLPNIPRILGLILLLSVLFLVVLPKDATKREKVVGMLCVVIMVLAAYLRWNELVRIAGTPILGDAQGYFDYAKKMDLFSENGFYSAQFEKREPLYILIVKMFFLVFGVSATHLRFVSFVFSLVTVYLTYTIGKEWFNEIIGLTASFIISVHPYLIDLSVRGLREEWFTSLLLLLIYYGYVKGHMDYRWRTVITGLLLGCILLTRSESLFMVAIIMITYPVVARSKWNYGMVFAALLLGIVLFIPHQYNMYKTYGDPFYTVNQYTRFYANREFAGQPGFPTKEELAKEGMYTGRKITPIGYYFLLHTPSQFIYYSIVGFAKIHLTMPLHFSFGKGNLRSIRYALGELQRKINMEQLVTSGRLLISIVQKDWWNYGMTAVVLLLFLLGVLLIAFSPYSLLLVYMLFLQMQTSFLAYLGIDTRLSVHSYPFIALCCGYSIWWLWHCAWKSANRPLIGIPILRS